LVDDSGDVVEKDFDDQADMCEIVRAAIAAGKFEKITMDLVNIPVKVLYRLYRDHYYLRYLTMWIV